MNWTKEQEQAISQRDKNIIVSAAAGSGKTAVLVERIRRLAVEEGIPLDRMLVVTFTNAAASEMKEKIRASLLKEMESNPENITQIKAQLDRLPMASISTFHAFAGNVIRRFFYLANVDAKYKICDEERAKIFKEEALDVVIEEAIGSADESVLEFFDCYSSDKDFESIRTTIRELYKNVISNPDRFDVIDRAVDCLKMDINEFKKSSMAEIIETSLKNDLEFARKNMQSAISILDEKKLKRLADKIRESDLSLLDSILDTKDIFDSYDKIGALLNEFKPATLRAKKEETSAYNEVKDNVLAIRTVARKVIDGIRKKYFIDSLEDALYYINETAKPAGVLAKLIRQYDIEFTKRKRKYNLLDFNDIEHVCLEILQHEEASEYYREKFKCILVDEFQDTNLLQDAIISKIKDDRNLFMVGDIKQCIYKFRLAEPEIFRRIYDSYSSNTDNQSCAIDLNKNYRSKQPVIDFINNLFYQIMPGYDDKAALYCGMPYDGPHNYTPHFDIIDLKASKYVEIEGHSEVSDEAEKMIKELSYLEIEALYIAQVIKKHIGEPFWDSKRQVERLLEPKDVAVLLRGGKQNAVAFYSAIKKLGIDAKIEEIGGFFENLEIDVFINLLNIIDNRKQDIPLISVLHSDIFGFSSAELAQIRSSHQEGKFYDAFISYDENDHLADKCKAACRNFDEWKELSRVMPLDDFIWKVMLDTGHYLAMGAMPMGNQRQMNLRLLVEKAGEFTTSNQSGLYGFLSYLKNLKVKKFDASQSNCFDENENAVNIMTIHKSKGLEFPMVVVSGMSKKLNYDSKSGNVIFQSGTGLGLPYINNKQRWKKTTLMEQIVDDALKIEKVEEEKRILYVAMTRARDILYLIGTTTNIDQLMNNVEFEITKDSSYMDMSLAYIPFKIVKVNTECTEEDDAEDIDITKEMLLGNDIYEANLDAKSEEIINKRLDFEYPHKYGRILQSKYSVSELNKMENDVVESEFAEGSQAKTATAQLRVPNFAVEGHTYTAAEMGTLYHTIMEHLDFSVIEEKGLPFLKDTLNELVSDGIFLKEEVEKIDIEKVLAFFDTDLGKRAISADRRGVLNKERNFTLNVTEYGESYIVQGVIDGYFEEDGELVLFDYKTNKIRKNISLDAEKNRIHDTYEMQMQLYKTALEKATGKRVKEIYLFLADVGCTVEC